LVLLIPVLYTRSIIHYGQSNATLLMVLCEKSTVANYAFHTTSYIATVELENALPVSERWHFTLAVARSYILLGFGLFFSAFR